MAIGTTMYGDNVSMASNLLGEGGEIGDAAIHWIANGVMVGIGALASVKIAEMV